MGNKKMKFWEISKLNDYKRSSRSSSDIFSSTPRKMSKRIIEAEPNKWLQSKDSKNLGEFDILTKDSVWNIEKRALKDEANSRNVPTWVYPLTLEG